MDRQVMTMVTQVIVDKDDPAFTAPTKPIGPYYTKEQADEMAKDGVCRSRSSRKAVTG